MPATTKAASTKPSATGSSGSGEPPGLNLAVLCGPCSGPADVRVLESGTRVATLAVRCPAVGASGAGADERATSVPVTVWDPPAWGRFAFERGLRL